MDEAHRNEARPQERRPGPGNDRRGGSGDRRDGAGAVRVALVKRAGQEREVALKNSGRPKLEQQIPVGSRSKTERIKAIGSGTVPQSQKSRRCHSERL